MKKIGKVSSESPKTLSRLNMVAFFQCSINYLSDNDKQEALILWQQFAFEFCNNGSVSEHQL